MNSSKVNAVLFVKDLQRVADFYLNALDMTCVFSDADHSVLNSSDFELIVHQIPKSIADGITIQQPPVRRTEGAIRLDFPVQSIEECRNKAEIFGGEIDRNPPHWAGPNTNFFFGYDPEGNQFGVKSRGN